MPAPALANSEISGGCAHVQDVASLGSVMQIGGDPTVGCAVLAEHPPNRDLEPRAHRRRGDGVLPRLAITIGQVDEYRNVLARRDFW
jgi:hypothetical protein